ncbi:unnamed protein product [Trichogramma brassicae]|uniref:protein-lysine 6-oxidase n=1 Tax=Trichogramma brassicae TaxID=86971 RepID=A0A6H5J6U3_9HYME|nr:unnamed protein product [Trichogramma brassicae]
MYGSLYSTVYCTKRLASICVPHVHVPSSALVGGSLVKLTYITLSRERRERAAIPDLYTRSWGNVCDDEWDEPRGPSGLPTIGLRLAQARATTRGNFGQARRRYWMDDVICDGGSSPSWPSVASNGGAKSDCRGDEAAGVVCHHPGYVDNNNRRSNINDDGDEDEPSNSIDDGARSWASATPARAYQTNVFGSHRLSMSLSGIKCQGDERHVAECQAHRRRVDCPGVGENVAGVACSRDMADLAFDARELEQSAHLEEIYLHWLQCAMEENCLATEAYRVQRESADWRWHRRRLLKFTARTVNIGTADFRPAIPKHLWEWHMCHRHYHSMEVFATFDIIDSQGRRVAEGHKASFCLEDNQCLAGVEPRYKCVNYGDQGISVNCSDIYKYNLDCQWVDITELSPGSYTFKVAVNPELKIGEMTFENNAATCKLLYTENYARVHSCVMGRP